MDGDDTPLARQVDGVVGHRLWRCVAARICASVFACFERAAEECALVGLIPKDAQGPKGQCPARVGRISKIASALAVIQGGAMQ